MDEEKTIWQGHSSQVINLPTIILCGLVFGALLGAAILFQDKLTAPMRYAVLALAAIPVLFIMVKWIQNRCRKYVITNERIRITKGVFSRRTEEVELYRVRDYMLEEPFAFRLFGLGNLVITTMETTGQTIVLRAIANPSALRDDLRRSVEACRDRKGVRVTEFEQ